DRLLGNRSVTSLVAGVNQSASTVLTIPADVVPGTYYLGAIADAGHAVVELDSGNDTNNMLVGSTPITVTLFRPDLVMRAVAGPATGATGRPITVANTVSNQGSPGATAGTFRI